MALYSIKQETLTGIGDALRRRHGETKTITVTEEVDVPSITVSASPNSTSFTNFGGIKGENLTIEDVVTIPNASSVKVKVAYRTTGAYHYLKIYSDSFSTDDLNTSTSSGKIVNTEFTFENTDTITFDYHEGYSFSVVGVGYYAECTGYDADGNVIVGVQQIEVEKEVKNTYKSSEMAQAIDDIVTGDVLPEEAFVISGNCKYKFAGNGWNWFLDTYQDRISTENITSLEQMFDSNTNIESINFDFNCRTNTVCSVSYMFSNCRKLKAINGKIKNLKVSTMNNMFNNCQNLRYLPEFIDIDFTNIINTSYENCTNAFYDCRSLRSISENFLKQIYQPKCTGYYYAFLLNTFYECYSLDEVKGLNPQTGKMTSNMFNRTFEYCTRVKNVTFALNNGVPYNVTWKSQVINLAGYVGYSSSNSTILNYNNGITADKEVKDDASYQLLKNDPDWFATNVNYSRYNHDSAVATINSLPDTSAYLATAGGTNTIEFKGEAGASTDGGAINTLTEEEIAVATAKGWTVTFV